MMLVDPAPVVPTYIVTFNNNGIGTPTAAQEVRSGSRAAWPPNPVAYGYVFGGWYWEPSCINAFDFNTPISGNITLFARWTRYNGRSAKTGDESNIGLWITLMAVSAVGVTAGVLLGTRKRRKKKNRK